MSSLAATQADGYYVPVEYFESGAYKKQSKNQFNSSSSSSSSKNNKNSNKKGSGGGGGQGHGHNQWLQNGVVRFELPHRGRCLGPDLKKPGKLWFTCVMLVRVLYVVGVASYLGDD